MQKVKQEVTVYTDREARDALRREAARQSISINALIRKFLGLPPPRRRGHPGKGNVATK